MLETKLELTMSIENREDFDFYYSLIQKQFNDGAYNSVINISEIALNLINTSDITNDDKINILLIKGKALEQIGEYAQAIDELTSIDISSLPDQTKSKVYVLNSELYLKLNLYEDSLDNISKAENIFYEESDFDGLSETYKIKGHILRDTEKFDAAYSLAKELRDKILPNVKDLLSKAKIHRSISRALGSIFSPDAIKEAEISKSFAVKENSRRNIGNADFTLGEAYRLNKLYKKATDAYKTGLDIAYSLGNRDLEIYCKLSLTATMISMDNLESEYLFFSELERLDSNKFPVESLHFKLLEYMYKLLRDEEIPAENIDQVNEKYKRRFYRVIPVQYLKELLSLSDVTERKTYVRENPIRF